MWTDWSCRSSRSEELASAPSRRFDRDCSWLRKSGRAEMSELSPPPWLDSVHAPRKWDGRTKRAEVSLSTPRARRAAREYPASFPTLGPDYKGRSSWNLKLSLSPDGRTLALSTPSQLGVQLWHRESGRLLYTLPEELVSVTQLKWSPDGRRLAVSRSDGRIVIWSIA